MTKMKRRARTFDGRALELAGDGPLRPGFATSSSAPVVDDAAPKLAPDFARATYADLSEDEAGAVWARETLCATCYHAPVCKLADGLETALVVISRCRVYAPTD